MFIECLFSAPKVLFVCKMGAFFLPKNVLFFPWKDAFYNCFFLPKSTTIPESPLAQQFSLVHTSNVLVLFCCSLTAISSLFCTQEHSYIQPSSVIISFFLKAAELLKRDWIWLITLNAGEVYDKEIAFMTMRIVFIILSCMKYFYLAFMKPLS